MPTPDNIYKFLTHLIAMNGYPTAREEADKPKPESKQESGPNSPTPSESSEMSESTNADRNLPAQNQKMAIPHQVMICSPHQVRHLHFPQLAAEH